MSKILEYFDELQRDALEQFRGKPKIAAKHRAMARQLAELHEFFEQLITLRTLETAEGAQLDGIGDIVRMSRAEALSVIRLVGNDGQMDDETYRLCLAYKMHLNTSNCTHADVYGALRMFWDRAPLYYSEDPAHPATIFFSTPTLGPDDDVSALLLAPKIKAAGVALKITATTETPGWGLVVRAGGAAFPGVTETKLPQWAPGWTHQGSIRAMASRGSTMQTELKPIA